MKALIASVLLIISFSSHSAMLTGNELYEEYKEWKKETPVEWYSVGLYSGFVDGVVDSLNVSGQICLPTGVSSGQTFDMVGKHLEDNPGDRNRSAVFLVFFVMISSFPCEE